MLVVALLSLMIILHRLRCVVLVLLLVAWWSPSLRLLLVFNVSNLVPLLYLPLQLVLVPHLSLPACLYDIRLFLYYP
jgi:hypothetical protein